MRKRYHRVDTNGLYVNLKKMRNGTLRITFTPEGRRKAKAGDLTDPYLFEDIGTDSQWEYVRPEEVGALTDATILSDECERDDHGNLIKCGCIYSNINYYQIESDVARLLRLGKLIWPGTN